MCNWRVVLFLSISFGLVTIFSFFVLLYVFSRSPSPFFFSFPRFFLCLSSHFFRFFSVRKLTLARADRSFVRLVHLFHYGVSSYRVSGSSNTDHYNSKSRPPPPPLPARTISINILTTTMSTDVIFIVASNSP